MTDRIERLKGLCETGITRVGRFGTYEVSSDFFIQAAPALPELIALVETLEWALNHAISQLHQHTLNDELCRDAWIVGQQALSAVKAFREGGE